MRLGALLALKGRLWWRGIPPDKRAMVLVALALVLVAFAPAWWSGARLAFESVRDRGAAALVLVFAAAQATWILLALIAPAIGEAFDLRRMLRYPVHPRTVYLTNLVFSLAEAPAWLVLPALACAVAGAGARAGAAAAAVVALGAVVLVALTAAALQLVLALLLQLRRVPWLRFAHEGLAVLLATFGYLAYLEARRSVQVALDRAGPDLPAALARLAGSLDRGMPTAAWPARLAAAGLEGDPTRALAAALGAVALGLLMVEAGCRLAHRAALDRETASPARGAPSAARRAARDHSGARRVLRPAVALLLEREMTVALRSPALLAYALYPVLFVVLFARLGHGVLLSIGPFVTLALALHLQALTMSLFGSEREGLRLLFLLPFPGRALVLAKDLGVAAQFAVGVAVALGALAVVGYPVAAAQGAEFLAWSLALLATGLMIGNHLSTRYPYRIDRRGRAGSGAGVVSGLHHALVMFATLGGLAAARALAMRLAPTRWDASAAMLVAAAAAVGVALVWWRTLDGAGRLLDARRESVLAAITPPSEMG